MYRPIAILLKTAVVMVSVIIFPIGLYVLGYYTRVYVENRKIRKEKEVKTDSEMQITSNTETEKDQSDGGVIVWEPLPLQLFF